MPADELLDQLTRVTAFRFKGFALSSFAGVVTALPPDVRRWLCPADNSRISLGLCRWSGLGHADCIGPEAAPGA